MDCPKRKGGKQRASTAHLAHARPSGCTIPLNPCKHRARVHRESHFADEETGSAWWSQCGWTRQSQNTVRSEVRDVFGSAWTQHRTRVRQTQIHPWGQPHHPGTFRAFLPLGCCPCMITQGMGLRGSWGRCLREYGTRRGQIDQWVSKETQFSLGLLVEQETQVQWGEFFIKLYFCNVNDSLLF